MIRERTLSGIHAAQAAGKVVGRPKRVFRRDEVVRLRDLEGLSWRAIGRHGLAYDTTEIELPDRESAKLWIEENQLGRRNLSNAGDAKEGYKILNETPAPLAWQNGHQMISSSLNDWRN
jgi:hypothetical protein